MVPPLPKVVPEVPPEVPPEAFPPAAVQRPFAPQT
jgi:hypothetical protein